MHGSDATAVKQHMSSSTVILETPRLILRPRTLDDADAIVAMNLDPEIHRFLAGSFDDPEAHRREVMGRIARPVPAGLGYWSFMEKATPSVFCGYVSLIPVEHRGPEVEIGWRMPRACWGRGLMTEAASAILRYGFDDLGLDRILALIHPQNERSIRAAQRLGMRPAGSRAAYGFEMAVYAAGRAATQASDRPTPAPAAG